MACFKNMNKKSFGHNLPSYSLNTELLCLFPTANLIDVFKRHGHYGITYLGMSQGLTLEYLLNIKDVNISVQDLEILAFDLRTDPCIPKPVYTKKFQMLWLIEIILFCVVSCIFDIYINRWRSQICNIFYPKQSECRAINLYNRIKNGRQDRRKYLELILSHQRNKGKKLLQISTAARLQGVNKKWSPLLKFILF